ncbi:hypothetical protein [Wolbachia endosymbiont (group A) of Rhinocyllus conicus]|uniref:hypothetical protein n=1 Tax=Wolbachia endosymbiont (group A) of Rhinocyllus conicus TaxID=2954053 RepID=UPI002227A059|nr:hypothetical protein [Wolbachia endosymbiont (group A) of Rhinocyllus conicus]
MQQSHKGDKQEQGDKGDKQDKQDKVVYLNLIREAVYLIRVHHASGYGNVGQSYDGTVDQLCKLCVQKYMDPYVDTKKNCKS